MVYLLLALVILIVEFYLKHRIIKDERLPRYIWGGWLLLRRHDNYGLAFGQLKQHPWLPKLLVSLVIAVFLVYTLPWLLGGEITPLPGLALGLLYGGGLSNLLDRYIRGYVVDYFSFIKARWPRMRRLVFNLADICIFLGMLLMLVYICLNWQQA